MSRDFNVLQKCFDYDFTILMVFACVSKWNRKVATKKTKMKSETHTTFKIKGSIDSNSNYTWIEIWNLNTCQVEFNIELKVLIYNTQQFKMLRSRTMCINTSETNI